MIGNGSKSKLFFVFKMIALFCAKNEDRGLFARVLVTFFIYQMFSLTLLWKLKKNTLFKRRKKKKKENKSDISAKDLVMHKGVHNR